jgi:uncharacterized membrane protein YgdD (TMEM256/DUF423 family)
MILQPQAKRSLLTATTLLALAVAIGAFGAHGLKQMVTAEKLITFETGVRYHFYHSLGLLLLGVLQQLVPTINLRFSYWSFLLGVLLFSFNCYIYVVSDVKFFAMIVPLGGLSFILGWLGLSWNIFKLK